MRKFLHILLTSVTLISIATLTSCKDSGDDPQPEPKPKPALELSCNAIEVAAEGGEFTVTYTVNYPVEGTTLSLTCDAEWVHMPEPTDSEILISVDANTEESSRETTITVSYGDAPTYEISVTQKAHVAPAPFSIEIEEVSGTKCITNTTVTDHNMWYIMYFVEISYFSEYGITTAEELFNDDKATYMRNADFDGMNLGDYMEQYQAIFKGNKRVQWSDMQPGKQYVLYMYGIEFNADRTDYTMLTDVYHEIITAKTADIIDGTFSLEVTVEGPEVTFDITPEGWSDYYTIEIYENGHPLYLEEGAEVDKQYTTSLCSNLVDNCNIYMMYYGYTIQDILDNTCYVGTQNITRELMSEVLYCVVVYGVKEVDGVLQLVTTPVVEHFATERVTPVDMTIEIKTENIGSRVVDITATPSLDTEQYALILMPSEYITSTTEEDIIDELLINYIGYAYTFRGEISTHVSTLYDNTEYSIFCMGFHGGVVTTELFRHDFKTEVATTGQISILDVEIKGPYAATDLARVMPEKFNDYANYTGNYVMTIEPKTDTPTDDVFYLTWDYYTYEYYRDYHYDIIIEDTRAFYCDKVGISMLCGYDTYYLVTALAMDSKGNLSDLYTSDLFMYTENDLRPIEELVETISSAAASGAKMNSHKNISHKSLVYHK